MSRRIHEQENSASAAEPRRIITSGNKEVRLAQKRAAAARFAEHFYTCKADVMSRKAREAEAAAVKLSWREADNEKTAKAEAALEEHLQNALPRTPPRAAFYGILAYGDRLAKSLTRSRGHNDIM